MGLQGGEIIIILLIALVVLGPTRLPELARKAGQWTTELRNAARDISRGLEAEVNELKQVGDELKGQVDDIKGPIKELQDDVKAADPRSYEWKGPKPVSGPTPEDAMRDLEEIEKKRHSDSTEAESRAEEEE
jgi:sec-independent protein translocase protein TatB